MLPKKIRDWEELVEGFEVGPGGKLGHRVNLSEELANDLAGVFSLAEPLDLAHGPRERVLSLRNRHI